MLQFSVETGISKWKTYAPATRFNWATDFSPWKHTATKTGKQSSTHASIGPRIFLRGNTSNTRHASRSNLPSFNWATDFSPWKLQRASQILRRVISLQLGHGFFSVETCVDPDRSRVESSTLQLGHGFFSVETGAPDRDQSPTNSFNWATDFSPWKLAACHLHADRTRFNWATDFSPWKLPRRSVLQACRLSFNWATDFSPWKLPSTAAHAPTLRPLQLGHGFFSVETAIGRRVAQWLRMLQLGHGFFSVETACAGPMRPIGYAASIGPRIFLRGNRGHRRHNADWIAASIGPRIFLRGNRPHGI